MLHVAPPSVVPTTVVHAEEEEQGATPSIQPYVGEIQLSDVARKPVGSPLCADPVPNADGPANPMLSKTARQDAKIV